MKKIAATFVRGLVVLVVAALALFVNVPIQAGGFFAKPASVNQCIPIGDCQSAATLCGEDEQCCSCSCTYWGSGITACD
jgi:hypothetical protein